MKRQNQANQKGLLKNEKGIVLAITLMLIAVLALLGTTSVMTTTTDMKIASNYRENTRALYNAEAGVHAVIAKVDECGFTWPTAIGGSQTVTVTAPSGYSFDNGSGGATISVTKEDAVYYSFQVTGYGAGNSNARKTIRVYFRRMPFGLFAENDVHLKDNSKIYSYNSNTTPNPNPADYPGASTRSAYVGSNKKVDADQNVYISGNIGLGKESDGDDAIYDPDGTTTLTGSVTKMCRVNRDPLGAVGGALAGSFTAYSSLNDNAAYMTCPFGGCTATKIDAGFGQSVFLSGKSGGSNFYFTEIKLDGFSVLWIDTTNGPVNIYLTGKLEAKDFSTMNVNGLPPSITIYANSDKDVKLDGFGVFKGTIYAPYAPVFVKDNVTYFGLIWGDKITLENSEKFFYDEALKNVLPLNDRLGVITSWKDLL